MALRVRLRRPTRRGNRRYASARGDRRYAPPNKQFYVAMFKLELQDFRFQISDFRFQTIIRLIKWHPIKIKSPGVVSLTPPNKQLYIAIFKWKSQNFRISDFTFQISDFYVHPPKRNLILMLHPKKESVQHSASKRNLKQILNEKADFRF